jgi:poly(A) polymerase
MKTYTKDQHAIEKHLIDEDALDVLETLRQNGYIAYLVGGSVRDLLLNYRPKDYDISTNALPEQVKKCFPQCFIVGKRFRLAHVRVHNKIFEVATFRKGDNEDDTLIYNDNEWGTELEDVSRRDFTVNGLFYCSESETIIDYVGGVEDAKKGFLRCIGNPYIRFKQDPVRMIRLLKFRSRFGLTPDEEMIEALFALRKEILKSSPMRILEELLRMLESGSSVPFLKNLQKHGFLQTLLPNLADHFQTPLEHKIYTLLGEVDRSILIDQARIPFRSVLVSCLVFPVFDNKMQEIYKSSPRKAHLGRIQDEAFLVTSTLFEPSLKITKKILADVAGILTTQYRFTPLQKKKATICKIPKSPDFSAALKFFKLRADVEPGFTDIYNEWKYYYEKHKTEHPRPPKSPRNRKRA